MNGEGAVIGEENPWLKYPDHIPETNCWYWFWKELEATTTRPGRLTFGQMVQPRHMVNFLGETIRITHFKKVAFPEPPKEE